MVSGGRVVCLHTKTTNRGLMTFPSHFRLNPCVDMRFSRAGRIRGNLPRKKRKTLEKKIQAPPAHLQFDPAGCCRSESTSQIVRGAPPRYRARSRSRPPGVVNSIRNLEALSEPQAAWASGRVRVRISNLRLANGPKMAGNCESTGHCRWVVQ